MKSLLPVLVAALLVGCGENDNTKSVPDTQPADTLSRASIEQPWTGYYEGTFQRSKDQKSLVQLWVRSDSTFVIRQRAGKDEPAEGGIGKWSVVKVPGGIASGLLSFQYHGDPPDHYQHTDKGLVFVDVINGVEVSHEWFLNRMAVELDEPIGRMRVDGTFNFLDNSMSFTPCGTDFVWPCAGGQQWTDEGEKGGSLHTLELERHYLLNVKKRGDPWTISAEVTLAMGPAMEGDEKDEYIFIHRVLKHETSCP